MRTVESSRIFATSADATPVGALAADPFTGIVIPVVALVGDSPERCLDIVPSGLVIESAANQFCDECAASPASSAPVEFGGPAGDPDDVILNLWTAVVELSDATRVEFDECAGYGCTPDELVGDEHAPTQSLADQVRASGARAMVVPSAALPGTHNLILFGESVLHPYLWQPLAPEEIPTGHLADGARVAGEMASHVRWFGSDHTALEQWKATGSYELFDDHMATRW